MYMRFNGSNPIGGGGAVLLVHADSGVADSSPSAHTLTANGGAVHSSSQSKFGGASLTFDGSNDWWESASSSDWQFGSGPWSIDFWLYVPSTTTLATDNTIVSCWKAADLSWWVGLNASGHIRLFQSADGTTADFISLITATAGITDTWMHICIAHPSGHSDVIGWKDGVVSGNRTALTLHASAAKLGIGAHDAGTAFTKTIFVDELRICKTTLDVGTTNFTPPSAPYT